MTRHRALRAIRALRREEGSGLVEFAFACTILLAMMFGICEITIGIYAGHFTSDAARQATRYAMVRGSTSCTNTPNLSGCNATAAVIQTYVRGLNYPGITHSKVTMNTTWLTASSTTPTTWSACATGTCNGPGSLVKVVVTYPLTFHIPFGPTLALNLSSTSQMVISQ